MLLFCVKTIMKETCKFELAHLKKNFGRLLQRFLVPLGMLFAMKTLEDEW